MTWWMWWVLLGVIGGALIHVGVWILALEDADSFDKEAVWPHDVPQPKSQGVAGLVIAWYLGVAIVAPVVWLGIFALIGFLVYVAIQSRKLARLA
ncbi:MAG: hypothetical protein COY40_06075 [Alphaproteobacteria bacterium CG_4_10_14_0_8_um_filter_53_9]|nr:MAG: hypothetical protein COY40_06075 [Alphaproteobacteria bacterium CG_4_10_14_0_8_um_filter_53_9]